MLIILVNADIIGFVVVDIRVPLSGARLLVYGGCLGAVEVRAMFFVA
jgi:hypothetical protein